MNFITNSNTINYNFNEPKNTMATIKLKAGRGYARLPGTKPLSKEKVQALKQRKTVEASVEEVASLKPGIYQVVKEQPKPSKKEEAPKEAKEEKPKYNFESTKK